MGTQTQVALDQHTVMATYRLRSGAEAAFREILRGHERTLRALGMVEAEPTRIFRQQDDLGRVTLIEVFTWAPGAVGRAHQHPEVAATWENMGQHVEPHGDLPAMSFPHYSLVTL